MQQLGHVIHGSFRRLYVRVLRTQSPRTRNEIEVDWKLNSDDEVHAQMDVNLYGPYRLIRAALPGLRRRKSGTIVNISSVSGIDGAIASGLYAASKFALEGNFFPQYQPRIER